MRMWKMALLFLVDCGDSVTCARTKEMVPLWTICEDKGNDARTRTKTKERCGGKGERKGERETHTHTRTDSEANQGAGAT